MASAIDLEAWRELYSRMGKRWCDPGGSGASSTTSSVVVLTQTDERSCDEEMVQSADEEMGPHSLEEEEEVSSRCVEVGSVATDVGDLSTLEEFDGGGMDDEKRKIVEAVPRNVRYKMTCVSKPGPEQFAPRWTNCSRPQATSASRAELSAGKERRQSPSPGA